MATEKALHSFSLILGRNPPGKTGFLWALGSRGQPHVRTEGVGLRVWADLVLKAVRGGGGDHREMKSP